MRWISWDADAGPHSFIVSYPASSATRPAAWNAAQGGPDVSFLRDVVADISATWCIDPKREELYIALKGSGSV